MAANNKLQTQLEVENLIKTFGSYKGVPLGMRNVLKTSAYTQTELRMYLQYGLICVILDNNTQNLSEAYIPLYTTGSISYFLHVQKMSTDTIVNFGNTDNV